MADGTRTDFVVQARPGLPKPLVRMASQKTGALETSESGEMEVTLKAITRATALK